MVVEALAWMFAGNWAGSYADRTTSVAPYICGAFKWIFWLRLRVIKGVCLRWRKGSGLGISWNPEGSRTKAEYLKWPLLSYLIDSQEICIATYGVLLDWELPRPIPQWTVSKPNYQGDALGGRIRISDMAMALRGRLNLLDWIHITVFNVDRKKSFAGKHSGKDAAFYQEHIQWYKIKEADQALMDCW